MTEKTIRKLRKVIVRHRMKSSRTLYAVISRRSPDNPEYSCQFYDTEEDAIAFAAELDLSAAFAVRPLDPPETPK